MPWTNGDGGASQEIGDDDYTNEPARHGWVGAGDEESMWNGTTKSSYRHKDESSFKHGHGGPLMTPNIHLGPVVLAEHRDGIVGADGIVEVRLDKVAEKQN